MNLHVKPNDKTGFWEIHDACGYVCKLESESTAALIVHAVNVLPELVTALEDANATIKALDDDFDLRPSYIRACAALKDANDTNPPPALRSRLKPERRNTMNNLLDVLTREGVLINVSVRYWRGCKKLRPEDLGLKADDVSNRLISLGHKRLLPKSATADLALIEGRAHALIDTNTFPFLNGLGHFLPNPRLAEITDKLRTLETEFWRAKENFVCHYDRHRRSAMEEWRTVAAKLVPDPAQLVATIANAFPLSLGKHFGFDTTLFQIAVPEQLTADLITLAEQQQVIAARQQAAHAASAKIRGDVETFVAECVASLREQTATLCEEMLQSISDGKTDGVHQKTLNRLTRFIDQFKQMNFANDVEMAAQLDKVRGELLTRTAAEYRDSRSAQRSLRDGLSALAGKARELAQADARELVQQFGQLGRRRFHLAA